jgi:thymidylate kinase
MFTVALIGPDGAGKTTVSRRLLESFPLPITYLYMGVNTDSSNRMLPTTWLARRIRKACKAPSDTHGPRDPRTIEETATGNPIKRGLKVAKSFVGLANKLAEETYRQTITWYQLRRGRIVLFDRHYFSDYYAYDVAPTNRRRTIARRIHGYFLDRVYPRPDLIILLDAPAEVLFARKGEGTLELLEGRRNDYLQIRALVPHFSIVDAAQSTELVVRDVQERILEFHRLRTQPAMMVPTP